jgi:1,4-dihydroxy-2-naphthoate octaprenyltransferase
MGTDRVFNPNDEPPISSGVLWLGLAAFAGAAATGILLAREAGWPVLLYAGLGGLAAAFYVGPPIRWVYLGLGEAMIALSYGPWMTLGSLHLQTQRFSWGGLLASMVPACLIAALAVVNEIPDFHQDRLVGKRNLVVRFGRRAGVRIYLGLAAAGLAIPAAGVLLGLFPWTALGTLAAVPLLVKSGRAAADTYETPLEFVPAVRSIVLAYVVGTVLFSLALAFEGLR